MDKIKDGDKKEDKDGDKDDLGDGLDPGLDLGLLFNIAFVVVDVHNLDFKLGVGIELYCEATFERGTSGLRF